MTTKGDLYTFSTVDARLGVGANDTVLTADSGLKLRVKVGRTCCWWCLDFLLVHLAAHQLQFQH
jgi:hypothetical protein